MSKRIFELTANRDLIDPDFTGYRLSLDNIPKSDHQLPVEIHSVTRSDDYFSYLHVRLFGLHNHLIIDQWYNDQSVYYITKDQKLMKVEINSDEIKIERIFEVWEIPNICSQIPGKYNVSVIFPTNRMAVLSDGAGILYILATGNRQSLSDDKWTIEQRIEVLGQGKAFKICDSRMNLTDLHCLLMSIEEKEHVEDSREHEGHGDHGSKSRFCSVFYWVILEKSSDMNKEQNWLQKRTEKIKASGEVNYSSFSTDASCLFLSSDKPLEFPDRKDAVENSHRFDHIIEENPDYYWHQTSSDIELTFNLPRNCTKDNVQVVGADTYLNIEVNQKPYLFGETFRRIIPDLLTYTVESGKLEIILTKFEEGVMWDTVVFGNDNGKEIMDSERRKSLLEPMISESEENIDCSTAPSFNIQQLEECDNLPCEHSRIYFVDGNSFVVTNEVNVGGHRWLFNVSIEPEASPYFCARYDVDGLLYQLHYSSENCCIHVATLNAFGYIHASKNAKFTTTAPDLSYAVISDVNQTISIYRQAKTSGSLYNRKNNKKFTEVGKNHIISLNTSDEIMGLHASNKALFVITKNKLYVYFVQAMIATTD